MIEVHSEIYKGYKIEIVEDGGEYIWSVYKDGEFEDAGDEVFPSKNKALYDARDCINEYNN